MVYDARALSGIGVLAAIVEAGAFSRAGEALGLTQSGVSRAVARLEERLGIRLFHRTARAVTLTDDGRRFYEEVRPLLDGLEEAANRATGSAQAVRGNLRITTDAAFGHFVLAPNIHRFLERHPGLSVEVAVRDRMGDVVAEGFDVAVRFGEPEPSALIARLVLRTRVLTCASPGYLARHAHPAHPSDLDDGGHACIRFRNPATGRPFAWEFHRGAERVAVRGEGRLTVNDTGALLGACVSGLGIAQPLELYARGYIEDGRLVPLLEDWAEESFPLHAYLPTRQLTSAKVRAFLAFMAELAEEPKP
ncbi:DNA-binding transcriptional LysR family regulator [Methylobacterium sp. PvP062]|uniref:DNA-binding transcriptional LysR family regulator n=1 Tax=Methylobacterium radiotolerans TaxID=31998 RepID=A0ABV2NKV1_9HYPH|nr:MULTISPECIES: LysR family transcriptional regulator [unclassified Methylobacterium]MBP2496143.1 DNA-binding transcriptional LysR family regulator [Methylobacterium sp. PvP105]MBP2503985.1 DNA-binding transcriptional LysR family regulator [Methylobacterium sp. PvP109]MCX7335546.1 LysR family transcriptional regulator [Hyphomicrobiales bacterium]